MENFSTYNTYSCSFPRNGTFHSKGKLRRSSLSASTAPGSGSLSLAWLLEGFDKDRSFVPLQPFYRALSIYWQKCRQTAVIIFLMACLGSTNHIMWPVVTRMCFHFLVQRLSILRDTVEIWLRWLVRWKFMENKAQTLTILNDTALQESCPSPIGR